MRRRLQQLSQINLTPLTKMWLLSFNPTYWYWGLTRDPDFFVYALYRNKVPNYLQRRRICGTRRLFHKIIVRLNGCAEIH